MRIAIFSDNFYPELSGISDSIITTGKELARRGHILNFYAPSHPPKDFALLNLPNKEIDLGANITVTRLWSLPFRTGTGQGRAVIPTGVRTHAVQNFNPDIIHAHLPFGTGIEGMLAAKILKKPFIGTNHTPMAEFVRYSPIAIAHLNDYILRYTVWFYNQCNFISSPAQAVVDEMKTYGFHQPYKIISNPIDTATFRPYSTAKRSALKKKLGFSPRTILYAGRLAKEKRIDLGIRAVAKLIKKIPDLMYVIVGHGASGNELNALAASLGIAQHVKILGFIEGSQAFAEVYNASDAFIIMSTAESQSIVAMQAMACGIPVIASKSWGLGEYVTQKTGISIPRSKENTLPSSIEKLFKNSAQRRAIGNNGHKYVQQFSPVNIAKIWEGAYNAAREDYNKKQ